VDRVYFLVSRKNLNNMKKITLTFCVLFCVFIQAQPPSRFFNKYGGNGIDVGYSVKQTKDKQYVVAGSTSSYGAGNTDFYLIRIDSMGFVMWERTYGGFNNDVANSVIQLADSGYAMAGFSNSFGNGGYDAVIIRTDKNGNQLWLKSFGGLDWDFGYGIVQISDGSLMMCGSTASFGNGKIDGFVTKFSLAGDLLWEKYYGGTEDDELKAIINTKDNQIACVGYTKSLGDLNGNGYFIKLNLNGDTIFTRNFGAKYKDYATDLHQLKNDDYVIVGAKTFAIDSTKTHSYFAHYNSLGNFKHDSSFYHSTANENYVGVTVLKRDTFSVVYLRNVPVPNFAMQGNVFIHHPSGFYFQVNSFGGSQDETFYSIDATADSGFVCVGTTKSFNAINGDVIFYKIFIAKDSVIFRYDNIIGIKENPIEKAEIKLKNLDGNLYQIDLISEKRRLLILTDLYGNVIYKRNIESKSELVELSKYNIGVYILTITSLNDPPCSFKLINR
jgi:hypothetical protein